MKERENERESQFSSRLIEWTWAQPRRFPNGRRTLRRKRKKKKDGKTRERERERDKDRGEYYWSLGTLSLSLCWVAGFISLAGPAAVPSKSPRPRPTARRWRLASSVFFFSLFFFTCTVDGRAAGQRERRALCHRSINGYSSWMDLVARQKTDDEVGNGPSLSVSVSRRTTPPPCSSGR